ncbi:MAG: adenylate/guanylate cyclase domain-containing protein [Methylovulum sp.]|uniref:CHASE2 domain-containing protein n=1 Tax=Methylovulum sp. TaxID=1916980 RepID=UPI002614C453|nr:adenylate/guanylate cyclase domain-containing protein [Methylovulum sp.]MDD2724379.1 adenylate/guanylate cyclase domain-containing protein [Methylovulum sp.]MDD5124207.1 adenylate/guanylate cyclase domain-containing protein [Methylovulum sp.]
MLNTVGLLALPTLERMENIFYDLRLRNTLVNTVDPRIVIVTIDEASLSQEGQWPWSRDKMAYLVDILFDYYGIKLLGFDMVFPEPDTSSGITTLNKLATTQLHDDARFLSALERLKPQLSYDDTFAKSLKNRPVVLGYFFSHIKEKLAQIGKLPLPLTKTNNLPFSPLLFDAQSYAANLPELQNAAASAGFFENPFIDQDGIYRKLPLLIQYQHQLYESLSLALFRALLDYPAIEFAVGDKYGLQNNESRLEGLRIEGISIPVDESAAILLPFRGRQGSFNYISATDVLNGLTDVTKLKDKIVILGATAVGLLDSRATPVQHIYPGVEVHANILSAMLDQTIKSRPNYIIVPEMIELLAICLLVIFLFPHLTAIRSALTFSSLLACGILANFYCWTSLGIDTILAIPITLLFLLYGIQIFFGFFLESRKKRQLSAMFGQYIPPELVEQMSQSDEAFSLKGESREMTVFFSDVRGFTTISETQEPQALCEIINAIFTPATHLIHEANGTIDKYIGDAIMAFWGAPMHNPHHASGAVQSALAIVDMLATLQSEFTNKGWPVIDMGIGINTGTMNVGNMGSQFRMAYTVMGDAVNLGSRLEELTKQYGVKIIVSESTRLAAPGFVYRELDRVRVKGKQYPITIYEPIGKKADILPEQYQTIGLLESALRYYRQQQWTLAIAIFTELSMQHPNDKLYTIYLERIGLYQSSPPETDWDGVFTYTSK